MVRCRNECPNGLGNMCCNECGIPDCKDECSYVPDDCGMSYQDTTTEIVPFQTKALAVMQQIVYLDRQKKRLEVQDKEMRQELQRCMDEYGIKSFENDILKITYIEPTVRTTIDSARLKQELPAVAEKYSKRSMVKASVRIEVK